MDHETHQNEKIFNNVSENYDVINNAVSVFSDNSFRKYLAKTFKKNCDDKAILAPKILDFAAGTGEISVFLKKYIPSSVVFAEDISEGMLDVLNRKVKSKGIEGVKIKKQSIYDINYESVFDGVSAAFAMRNLSKTKEVFSKVYSALNNKGEFLVLDFFRPKNHFVEFIWNVYAKNALPLLSSILNGGKKREYIYLLNSVRKYYKVNEFVELAKECGFNLKFQKEFFFGVATFLVFEKG